jgi:serine/threonine protein kinase
MGIVYKAQDTKLDRIVALKFLPQHLSANDAENARFLQEARAAATLNHPHVCTIYRIDEHEGQQYIEMEYVEGQTLRKKLPLQKADDVLSYALQIGDALGEAHSHGIVHRDVKAENIMVNSKNQIKVMDFGLAKLKGSLKLTRTSSTVGTLAYMAPEQITGGEVDARSDIFSFGIVLFEMLSGKTPFRGEHDAAMMYSIINEAPESILTHRPEVSPELDRIIQRALEKEPEDRYQSVADMVSELRREQKKSSRVVRPATSQTMRAQPSADREEPVLEKKAKGKRTGLIALGVGTTVALAAAAIYLFAFRPQAIDSLAVLPFTNVTTDPNAEYLAEGITENITNKLSQLSKLRVVPRSMVARYKGKDADPREVGKDLSVSAVLTGKVTQHGDDLTIQTELIDIRTISQLWGEQYNKKLSDIILVQQDIAQKVTEKLQTQVSGEEQKVLSAQRGVNPQAYQLYLKGHFYVNKRSVEGYRRGLDYFQQAISIDPNFALAYLGLGEAYIIGLTFDLKTSEYMPKLKEVTLKALALDPGLAEAYSTLGVVKAYFDFDFPGAEQTFRRAIELNPAYPTAHHWLAEFLVFMGRFDEGLAEYQRATELDPASLPIASDYGLAYTYMRQYDRSIEFLKKTIDMDPGFVRSHFYIMQPYLKKGMNDEAFKELINGMVADGDSATRIEQVRERYAASGFKGISEFNLRRFPYDSTVGITPGVIIDLITVGRKDQALSLLEHAFAERDNLCATMKVNPDWDPLRNEPRFIALMKKMGFEN